MIRHAFYFLFFFHLFICFSPHCIIRIDFSRCRTYVHLYHLTFALSIIFLYLFLHHTNRKQRHDPWVFFFLLLFYSNLEGRMYAFLAKCYVCMYVVTSYTISLNYVTRQSIIAVTSYYFNKYKVNPNKTHRFPDDPTKSKFAFRKSI